MKKLLFISAILAASTSALAVQVTQSPLYGPSPAIPQIYADGLTRLQVPNLSIPERSAFSQMEALQQLGETYVQAKGCPVRVLGTVDIYADAKGVGDTSVVTPGSVFTMASTRSASDSFRGDRYTVQGATGSINGQNFVGLLGNYRFNKSGSIMEGDAALSVPNPQANGTPDNFSARVIKDFFNYTIIPPTPLSSQFGTSPRLFTLDWGLQVINKKGYPVSKYYQHSWSVKDNGIPGRTRFEKVRIAGGIPCMIAIETKGYNNLEQFNEQGWFVIRQLTASESQLPNVR